MRFLDVGESMLSPRNEHHFLGAAIGGIFGTLQQSLAYRDWETDRKSTRLNSSHEIPSRMPSSA